MARRERIARPPAPNRRSLPPLKTSISEDLKSDLPPSKWGKTLGATPVVLTVIATMLAGLASSEMTRAQYDRSYAAQMQSKAGDQWSFFQAKKLRSAQQQTTLDVIVSTAGRRTLDRDMLLRVLLGTPVAAKLDSPAGVDAVAALTTGNLPKSAAAPEPAATVRAALTALEAARPEPEIAALLEPITDDVLDATLRDARDYVLGIDAVLKPVSQMIDALEQVLNRPDADAALRRDLIAARVHYNGRRYDAEARSNQVIASLYELQVRRSNIAAERHHRRSEKFFYGMLVAQFGVIVSTLAIAARQRNLLWALASLAGAVAITFAAYVYLYV